VVAQRIIEGYREEAAAGFVCCGGDCGSSGKCLGERGNMTGGCDPGKITEGAYEVEIPVDEPRTKRDFEKDALKAGLAVEPAHTKFQWKFIVRTDDPSLLQPLLVKHRLGAMPMRESSETLTEEAPKADADKDAKEPIQEQEVTPEELRGMSIREIARLIQRDWKKVYFGAVPYLEAMFSLESIHDMYIQDPGKSIVAYFLGNANAWRGPVARAVKKELNKRLKESTDGTDKDPLQEMTHYTVFDTQALNGKMSEVMAKAKKKGSTHYKESGRTVVVYFPDPAKSREFAMALNKEDPKFQATWESCTLWESIQEEIEEGRYPLYGKVSPELNQWALDNVTSIGAAMEWGLEPAIAWGPEILEKVRAPSNIINAAKKAADKQLAKFNTTSDEVRLGQFPRPVTDWVDKVAKVCKTPQDCMVLWLFIMEDVNAHREMAAVEKDMAPLFPEAAMMEAARQFVEEAKKPKGKIQNQLMNFLSKIPAGVPVEISDIKSARGYGFERVDLGRMIKSAEALAKADLVDWDGSKITLKMDIEGMEEGKVEEEELLQEVEVGHVYREGDRTYVDTAFMNNTRGVMPGFEMRHLGFGEFAMDGPGDVSIEFDRMRGVDFPGQSGRSHQIYGRGPGGDEKAQELVDLMLKKRKAVLVETVQKSDDEDDDRVPLTEQPVQMEMPFTDRGLIQAIQNDPEGRDMAREMEVLSKQLRRNFAAQPFSFGIILRKWTDEEPPFPREMAGFLDSLGRRKPQWAQIDSEDRGMHWRLEGWHPKYFELRSKYESAEEEKKAVIAEATRELIERMRDRIQRLQEALEEKETQIQTLQELNQAMDDHARRKTLADRQDVLLVAYPQLNKALHILNKAETIEELDRTAWELLHFLTEAPKPQEESVKKSDKPGDSPASAGTITEASDVASSNDSPGHTVEMGDPLSRLAAYHRHTK
jgi:hypothetical protein